MDGVGGSDCGWGDATAAAPASGRCAAARGDQLRVPPRRIWNIRRRLKGMPGETEEQEDDPRSVARSFFDVAATVIVGTVWARLSGFSVWALVRTRASGVRSFQVFRFYTSQLQNDPYWRKIHQYLAEI